MTLDLEDADLLDGLLDRTGMLDVEIMLDGTAPEVEDATLPDEVETLGFSDDDDNVGRIELELDVDGLLDPL